MRLRESNPKKRKTVLGPYENAINIYFCSLAAGRAKARKSIEGVVLRRPRQCRHRRHRRSGAADPSAATFSVQKLERRQRHNAEQHTRGLRAPLARPTSVQGRRSRYLETEDQSLLQCRGCHRTPRVIRAAPSQLRKSTISEKLLSICITVNRMASTRVEKSSWHLCVKIIFIHQQRTRRANTASWMHFQGRSRQALSPRRAKPTDGKPWGWATEPLASSV